MSEYQVTRKQIVDAALKLRGVRFRHQGRSAATGVDCVGMLHVVLTEVRYPMIVDVEGYRRSPAARVILETFQANFGEINIRDAGLGDIFLMRIGGRKAKHASILVSNVTDYPAGIEPQIIHAQGSGDHGAVVVEDLENWRPHIAKAFRLRGLVD